MFELDYVGVSELSIRVVNVPVEGACLHFACLSLYHWYVLDRTPHALILGSCVRQHRLPLWLRCNTDVILAEVVLELSETE